MRRVLSMSTLSAFYVNSTRDYIAGLRVRKGWTACKYVFLPLPHVLATVHTLAAQVGPRMERPCLQLKCSIAIMRQWGSSRQTGHLQLRCLPARGVWSPQSGRRPC